MPVRARRPDRSFPRETRSASLGDGAERRPRGSPADASRIPDRRDGSGRVKAPLRAASGGSMIGWRSSVKPVTSVASMAKLLVCQHVPYEPLGTLDPKLRSSGLRIRYVNFGRDPHARPTLDGYAGVVILGGAMNVDEVERH